MRLCALITALFVFVLPVQGTGAQRGSSETDISQAGGETPSKPKAARELKCRPAAGWGNRRRARAAYKRAALALRSGSFDKAERYFEYARALAVRACAGKLEADALFNLGALALIRRQKEDAAGKLYRALKLYSAHGGRQNYGLTLANIGVLAIRNGDLHSAERSLRQAEKLILELGGGWQTRRDRRQIRAIILTNLAYIPFIQGKYTEAESLLHEAANLDRATDFHKARGTIRMGLARVAALRGRIEKAEELFSDARNIFRRRNQRLDEGIALIYLAGIAFERGRLEAAEQYVKEARDQLETLGDQCLRGAALDLMGQIARKRASSAASEKVRRRAGHVHREAETPGGCRFSHGEGGRLNFQHWNLTVLYSADF